MDLGCPDRDRFCIKDTLYPTPWIERVRAVFALLSLFPWLFGNHHIYYAALISDGKLVINQKLISVNLRAFLLLEEVHLNHPLLIIDRVYSFSGLLSFTQQEVVALVDLTLRRVWRLSSVFSSCPFFCALTACVWAL